jgi:hypothetical protein
VSALDLAAVLLAVASIVAAVVLVIAAASLVAALRDLRAALAQLRQEALPAVADLRLAAERAHDDLDRVDVLLDTAESVSGTVDTASKLAYAAVATPVVKVMSAATGTSRARQRFRQSRSERPR